MIGHGALLVTVSRILVAAHAGCRGEDRRKIEHPGDEMLTEPCRSISHTVRPPDHQDNEVANPCQTGAFGQMSGRRCFSVRVRATCSIKLCPG